MLTNNKFFLQSRNLVEKITKKDFSIEENDPYFFDPAKLPQHMTVFDDEKRRFVIGIFFFPKDFEVPIHDHPNMFAFSKILCGSAVRQSFTLQEKIQYQFTFPQEIKLKG
jgi:hypothetical protein